MQLQRFLILLALPVLISLSACIAVPVKGGHEEAFKNEKLAFIEIGKSTKAEIDSTMSDFPMETDEGDVRVNLTPQKFRGGDWWLYAQTRKESKWVILAVPVSTTTSSVIPIGDFDYRFLLIKFDSNGIVSDYELSSSEGSGCNRQGVCVRKSGYNLLAPEDEDRVVKEFDIPADRCGVYVYVKLPFGGPIWSGVPIWLDGDRVGSLLDKKQFFFWQLDQGVHQLQGDHERDSGLPYVWDQQSIEFSCAEGGLYFFELKLKSKGFFRPGFGIEIEQLDAAKGRKAIGKRQLTLNITEPSD